ncbi:hypothetical protein [Tunicatimonas pelagia]|uniref:hypothetical protein n=1 Tax=Tunicatimonas pelagia TaxID=931531 RepID=UPI0026659B3F|nr:hypothetical protein [Tunicatimonas pelagia]WKN45196.1 hypothetical protein P0M28_09515 [Tunicatimonas pelagia]
MKSKIIFILVVAALIGCKGEFVPDPVDPRLPRYSEGGKDAAGCFINGNLWRAVRSPHLFGADEVLRIRFSSEDSLIRFTIDGYQKELTDSVGIPTEISFVLDNRPSQVSTTPIASIGTIPEGTFILDGKQSYGQLNQGDGNITATNGTGQLTLRHVQLNPEIEDNQDRHYIVAGTFSFTAPSDSLGLIEVKSGRFDYSVRERKN